MKRDIKYRIKDVSYFEKYFILIEGKKITEFDLQNFNWEIFSNSNNHVKKILKNLTISTLYKNFKMEDTVIETNENLSFLTGVKYSKSIFYLKIQKEV